MFAICLMAQTWHLRIHETVVTHAHCEWIGLGAPFLHGWVMVPSKYPSFFQPIACVARSCKVCNQMGASA